MAETTKKAPQRAGKVLMRYEGTATFRVQGYGDAAWFRADWREVPEDLAKALKERFPGFKLKEG